MFFGKKKQAEVLAAMEHRSNHPRYWQMVWQRFRKNKLALWAFRGLMLLVFIALR